MNLDAGMSLRAFIIADIHGLVKLDWKSSYVLAVKGGFEKIYHFIGLSAMTSNVSGGVKCNYK